MHEAVDGTMRPSSQMFMDGLMANSVNAELLSRLPNLGSGECFLTAGCLFQATWNRMSGHPASWGVKDYDVFYFEANDRKRCSEALLQWPSWKCLIRLRRRASSYPYV